jgi:WD40 repeat protein
VRVVSGAKRGQPLQHAPAWSSGCGDYVVDLAVAAGERVVALTGAGALVVLDGVTGDEQVRVQLPEPGAQAMALHPAGDRVAVGCMDGHARVVDLAGRVLQALPVGKAWVQCVAWSGDGRLLATSAGKVVRTWTAEGAPVLESEPHAATVTALAWYPSRCELASATYGSVHLFCVTEGVRAESFDWKGSLLSLAFSPDGQHLAAGTQENSVVFWKTASGRSAQMNGYPEKPLSLSWSPDGSLLATNGDATLCCWEFRGKGPEGSRPHLLEGHRTSATRVAWHPSRELLASGDRAGELLLWTPRLRKRAMARLSMEGEITALAWSPAGSALYPADSEGHVARWDVDNLTAHGRVGR